MKDDRKRPGAGFWAAVVVGMGLAYLVGLGPACWLSSRTEGGVGFVSTAYRPVFRPFPVVYFGEYGKSPVLKMLTWYSELGAMDGWSWGPHNSVVHDEKADLSSPFVYYGISAWSWEKSTRSR